MLKGKKDKVHPNPKLCQAVSLVGLSGSVAGPGAGDARLIYSKAVCMLYRMVAVDVTVHATTLAQEDSKIKSKQRGTEISETPASWGTETSAQ